MNKASLPEIFKKTFFSIMRDHALAKFGDTLVNFIYSLAKTTAFGNPVGERVLDKALAEAVRGAGLRAIMPSSSSAGDIGDGAEALVAYAFLNNLMTIDEMVSNIILSFQNQVQDEEVNRSKERELMIISFTNLIEEIKGRIIQRKN